MYVVVTGPAAAGKSTLAAALADRLALPLLAKDEFKQALLTVHPPLDVEVFCRCDLDTMRSRYRQRTPTKGPGHFDDQRTEAELWPDGALRPLAGPWPVVEVDTSTTVDLDALDSRLAARRRHS